MPVLSSTTWRRFLLAMLCLLFALLALAQGKRFDFGRSISLDPKTNEKVAQYSLGNMNEELRFDQKTHHLNSRIISYDFNHSLVDKRVLRIQYDAQNQPAYLQSLTYNTSGNVIEGMEEVWTGNKLQQGYQWNQMEGKNWASLYNFNSSSYEPVDFETNWASRYRFNLPASSQYQVYDNTVWLGELSKERGQPTGKLIFENNTYGEGGSAEYNRYSTEDARVRETRFLDNNGVVREYRYSEVYEDDYMYEEITYYDCEGNPIYFESTMYDDEDYEVDMVDVIFVNGKPVAGVRDVDDYDEEGPIRFRQYFNPSSGLFEYMSFAGWKYSNHVFNMENRLAPCPPQRNNNMLAFGPYFLIEDAYDKFLMYGLFINYMYLMNQRFALAIQPTWTTGKQFDWTYNRINIMAGLNWFPAQCVDLTNPFSVSVHMYLGLAILKQKYKMGSNNY
ncbi:MAG TPA: hypothetical protein VGC29_08645, partial [Flavisolibacter sp.]